MFSPHTHFDFTFAHAIPQSTPDAQPTQLGKFTSIFSRSGVNYIASLHVEQQPDRARMCGFGDKDRRPITPPVCVKLSIRDIASDREIDPK